MRNQYKCLLERIVLIFFGSLLLIGGILRFKDSKLLYDYGIACFFIGLFLLIVGFFMPCSIVKKLTDWF